jgi:photosystem II stability/assembly factor-like uncharacterized protein
MRTPMRTALGTAAAAVPVLTLVLALAPAPTLASPSAPPVPSRAGGLTWQRVDLPHSHQSLRGLDAVDAHTAWVSGDNGGVWRTTDAGRTWKDVRPDAEKELAFRDVEADSAQEAQVLAIGLNGSSRIYKTTDGGKSWKLTFKNHELDSAFYDCMAMFADGLHGVAMSDPVAGKFRVIVTKNGGDSWKKVDPAGMPKAKDGEFAFAASGTCIVTGGIRDAWIASGGAASRVFHSTDYGMTWSVARTPIPADPNGGGVFSLAFRNIHTGIAVGGNFLDEDNGRHMAAHTGNGGATWIRGLDLSGYRSGVAWVPFSTTAIAVGPNGTDVSVDKGRIWTPIGTTGFHAVECVGTLSTMCWASGPDGMVGRLMGLPKG